MTGEGGEWECAAGEGGGGCDVSVSGEGGGCACVEGDVGGVSSCSRTQVSWTIPRTDCSSLTASLWVVLSRDTPLMAVMISFGFR